jgi:hypothetical protein
MAGISISGKHRATSKVASALASFLFEQEYDELENFTSEEKRVLRQASAILNKHC